MAEEPEGLMVIVSNGLLDAGGKKWVYLAATKQALDYMREGIAIKANQLERDMVREGEDVRPRFEFANKLKEEINAAREAFES